MSWDYSGNLHQYNDNYNDLSYSNADNCDTATCIYELVPTDGRNASHAPFEMADVTHSQLQPTAKEFTPSSSTNANGCEGTHLGAIRKNSNKDNNRNSKFNKRRYGHETVVNSVTVDNPPGVSCLFDRSRGYGSRRVVNNCNYDRNASYGEYVQPSGNFENDVEEGLKNGKKQQKRPHDRVFHKQTKYPSNNGWRRNNNNENGGKWRRDEHNATGRYSEGGRMNNWRHHQHGDVGRNNVAVNTAYTRKMNASSRREQLEQMIWSRSLECLVCCEKLRHHDKIWNCKQCYHILHLKCIKQWADSSKMESGWRCPACQTIYTDASVKYFCYCGKRAEPTVEPGMLPHSCGEVCGRKGRYCEHKCTLLCHPGPCPDCNVMVVRKCGCGSTEYTMLCSANQPASCTSICNKTLACGLHTCSLKCHNGSCEPCPEYLRQECYCGKVGRKIRCTHEQRGALRYECGETCEKTLSCGNHSCRRLCHSGPCSQCDLSPESVRCCPCGQTVIERRGSCLDPIPCCDKVCGKRLSCGQPGVPHECQSRCHLGPCPACPLTTKVKCRCGHMDKEIACVQLTSKADDARCEKKCTKKRLCGKHKCNQRCCIEIEHICPLPCNRLLSCGLHRCPLTCHSGKCPPCLETSFDELYCECGASVIYPPVACGTRPPKCSKPCPRARACGHDVNHNCHTGTCPPCTVLCKRWCYGRHEQRAAIPCHQENFSCGLACGRMLKCGRHNCVKLCHDGDCPRECTQPCTEPRTMCEHICGAPCHEPPCPETPCKQTVRVTCQCGLRSSTRLCMDLAAEYQNIAVAGLVSKMAELQKEHSVDISDIVNNHKRPSGPLKILDCNDECRLVERNRRLAIGLQIRNPDLSAKLTPRYSDYMRNWAKKDGRFCQRVHDKLTELVQLAKQSKQKSRSYSFESMNRDKRHFIHEYCEHFGCESAAYDQEPNRNVVATAIRDKSWLPSVSLLELIQRENGQRKVPGPVISKGGVVKDEAVSLRFTGRSVARPGTPPSEYAGLFSGSI